MSEKYELVVHSNEMCRSCLTRTSELKTIFRCDIVDGEVLPIPKIYTSVTSLPISDGDKLPANICQKCETGLIESYILKERCRKSFNLLLKILKIPEDDPDRIDTKYVEQGQSQSTQTDDESSGLIKKYEQTEIEDMAFMESEFIVTGQEEQTNLNMIVEEIDAEIEYEEISLVPRPTFIVECEFCNKKFDGDDQLDLHLKQHNELQPHLLASIEFFRCSRCLVVFSTMDSWMEHFGSVKLCEMSDELERIDYQYLDDVDNNDPPIRLFSCYKNDKNFLYTCDMCHGNFEQLADFKTHFNDFHLANVEENIGHSLAETPHQCGLCGKEERNLKTILHHIYFHQIDFDCPIENCKQKLSTFTDLYKHIVDEHAERDSFQCRNCLYLAKNREDLREHKQKSCAARTFECGDCGKTFLRKTTLTTHQRTHTNERRYACQFCDKSFLQSIDLNNHTRTHTQERPFSCGLCGKAFKTLSQRNDHVETHNTENKYECGVCRKTFKSERILHGHKKLHDEPQFECTICEKKFSRRYHLSLHRARRHNDKN